MHLDRERSLFESADPEVLATFWDAMHAMSALAPHDVEGGGATTDVEDGVVTARKP